MSGKTMTAEQRIRIFSVDGVTVQTGFRHILSARFDWKLEGEARKAAVNQALKADFDEKFGGNTPLAVIQKVLGSTRAAHWYADWEMCVQGKSAIPADWRELGMTPTEHAAMMANAKAIAAVKKAYADRCEAIAKQAKADREAAAAAMGAAIAPLATAWTVLGELGYADLSLDDVIRIESAPDAVAREAAVKAALTALRQERLQEVRRIAAGGVVAADDPFFTPARIRGRYAPDSAWAGR